MSKIATVEGYTRIPPMQAQGFKNIYRHNNLKTEFCLIPAGKFQMGLSEAEHKAALAFHERPNLSIDEMRPIHSVTVKAFMVSRFPVTRQMLGLPPDLDFTTNITAAMSTKRKVDAFLEKAGGRLPTEAEWEYLCRAGTKTLFTFGDTLPADEDLGRWCAWDYSEPEKQIYNAFGIGGLFVGEWCSDLWRKDYSPDAKPKKGVYVVRGGGAQFWPWQTYDEEFVWCMSAFRMPSTGLMEDKQAAFRIVFDL